jgi:hypothetical protein
MKNKDTQLIWESYNCGPRVPQTSYLEEDEDKQLIGGRAGGLIGLFTNRINNILRDDYNTSTGERVSDEEKLQQCNQIRDEFVNILSVAGSVASNTRKEDLVNFICSMDDLSKIKNPSHEDWDVEERTWNALAKLDPNSAANIDLITIISHIAGFDIERDDDSDYCRLAQRVARYSGWLFMPIFKFVMYLVKSQFLTPMITGLQTLNSLKEYSQIESKALEWISLGKRFGQSMAGVSKKVQQIVGPYEQDAVDQRQQDPTTPEIETKEEFSNQ